MKILIYDYKLFFYNPYKEFGAHPFNELLMSIIRKCEKKNNEVVFIDFFGKKIKFWFTSYNIRQDYNLDIIFVVVELILKIISSS